MRGLRPDYKFIDTGDGPAVFVIFILGFLALGGALYVDFTYGRPSGFTSCCGVS